MSGSIPSASCLVLHCNVSMLPRARGRGVALGMGWIYRHKRHGSVLALIALALQIVLAFDHVHLHGLPQNHHAAIVQCTAMAQTAPQMPAQNPADDDDYCAVCASIFL